MLGSLQDAEDAMQESLLRAWRALPGFEGRSSLRSWLYRIATNSCLRLLERRPRRVLPLDYAPAADPHGPLAEPLHEVPWIGPYPDAELGTPEPGPEARYEQREAVELAFIAALQHLPPRQRAALILTDVLGFAPREVAEALDAPASAVYNLLQRARKATAERLPETPQQATLQALGDERLRALAARYVDAWERSDVDAIRALLTEDATVSHAAAARLVPRPGRRRRLLRPAPVLARERLAPRCRWRSTASSRSAPTPSTSSAACTSATSSRCCSSRPTGGSATSPRSSALENLSLVGLPAELTA